MVRICSIVCGLENVKMESTESFMPLETRWLVESFGEGVRKQERADFAVRC